jgi:Na+/melibiose symporter-like transporter
VPFQSLCVLFVCVSDHAHAGVISPLSHTSSLFACVCTWCVCVHVCVCVCARSVQERVYTQAAAKVLLHLSSAGDSGAVSQWGKEVEEGGYTSKSMPFLSQTYENWPHHDWRSLL